MKMQNKKKKKKQKSQIPDSHQCIQHTPTCTTGASWDFLEQNEDELGDTIILCSDFNTQSNLWDQCGTNQQGCILEEALIGVLFTSVSTATPTHLYVQQGDTDSTIKLALVSPRLASWTCAETLTSNGGDHLPKVFTLQKPGNGPQQKPKYPFKYAKSELDVMLKLTTPKPTHTTNSQQKTVIQPPWSNTETLAASTDKQEMVKL